VKYGGIFLSKILNGINTELELKEYLKSNFNRDVDICREKFLKPYVKEHLMKEVIYV